ncbi:uncharacterized mitochondrial protein-like protein [Tanacetum coccineum]
MPGNRQSSSFTSLVLFASIVRDGENLDKMKEKASNHVSSDPGPNVRQRYLEQDSLSPGPQSSEKFPQVLRIFRRERDMSIVDQTPCGESEAGKTRLDIITTHGVYIENTNPAKAETRGQRPANLRQNPKQRVLYNPSANHATVLPITITESTSFTVNNNSPEWRQAMKEEYDVLMKNRTWSLVPRASNTNVVDGNNKGTIDNIICQLGSAFALKDLGPLNYFLGIEIVPHVFGILLSQKKYILELLQSDGLSNCNPVSSPMVTSSSLSLDDSTAFSNPVKYRQVVGSLQYVTISADIAFAVNKVYQYMHAPTENYWSAVKRILRYLYGTVKHDVDWAGDSDDRRYTRGFAIYLGSNLISWTARKQLTVSRSSTDAEYKALADTVAELTWLQALLNELGIRSSSTPILWCDNLGATYLSANPIFHARTKHVEIDYHFVLEKIAQSDLRV